MHNKEGVTYEDDVFVSYRSKADGALRDALSIFDRLTTFTQKNITLAKAAEVEYFRLRPIFEYCGFSERKEHPSILAAFNEIVKKGFDPHIFIAGLGSHFRDLMMTMLLH